MMLFQRHPALLSRVAVIMSFDLYVMQDIADRFAVANLSFPSSGGLGTVQEGVSAAPPPGPGPGRMAHTSSRSTLRPMRAHPIQSVSYGAVDSSFGPGGVPVPKLLLLTAALEELPPAACSVLCRMSSKRAPAGAWGVRGEKLNEK